MRAFWAIARVVLKKVLSHTCPCSQILSFPNTYSRSSLAWPGSFHTVFLVKTTWACRVDHEHSRLGELTGSPLLYSRGFFFFYRQPDSADLNTLKYTKYSESVSTVIFQQRTTRLASCSVCFVTNRPSHRLEANELRLSELQYYNMSWYLQICTSSAEDAGM